MNPQIQNQEPMLKESIKHFLTSYHSGSSDFSSFESIFFRLIQTMLDPPLEITWFYSAITFHAAKSSPRTSSRVVIARDLLKLLISCSNLSCASKKIALLAPVVYELYSVVCDSRKSDLCEKMGVGELVENMVSYVMMSAGVYDYGNEDVKYDNVVVCFEDLIRVWTTDRGGGSCSFGESLRMFFPLLTDGTWKTMNARCGMQELVGIVLCEVFLLRLFLSFRSGMSAENCPKDTRDQAVETIKGFRNCYFFDWHSTYTETEPTHDLHNIHIDYIELLLILIIKPSSPSVDMDAPAMNLMNDQNQSENYDDLLKNSISCFLREYPKSLSGLSDLISIFHRLVRDLKDPPLEIMWFYGAVMFHSCTPSILPPPAKLMVAKDLLETLNSCSCLSNVVKKVAVLAPVLYLLYHLELNFSARDPCLREEIGIVVEGIVSHISICCSQYLDVGDQGSDGLGSCILDLIRVWTVDQIRDSNEVNVLLSFFPTLGNEFQQQRVTVCLGYLAGVVMSETLLLRLYLKISPGIDKEDLPRDILNLAVQTIKGFQNFYFLDMLLKMLLEPSLPIAASLSSKDAVLLKKALYDAVILVDYSFYCGRWVESSVSRSKKLALLWVLAADHAIRFARASTDKASAVSYLNAFRESQLVAELINWAHSQAGTTHQNARPEITTPGALFHWLLVLEDQGIPIFDPSMSMLRAKAVGTVEINKTDVDDDQEMSDQSNKGFPGDLCLSGTSKKRKEALSGALESRVKQVKLAPFGNSIGEKFSPFPADDAMEL